MFEIRENKLYSVKKYRYSPYQLINVMLMKEKVFFNETC